MGRGCEVGFINVSVFGKAGEAAAEYLKKGWLVAVDDRLEYGEWDSDGTKRHDYTVVGNVEFLTAGEVRRRCVRQAGGDGGRAPRHRPQPGRAGRPAGQSRAAASRSSGRLAHAGAPDRRR
jgi:single-stranded DNA-binding protein